MAEQTAIVTGASSGVGRATARVLAAQDFTVILAARRVELLEQLRAEIVAAGGHAEAVACDVRDEDSVEQLFAMARQPHGRVDVLFNNAGVVSTGTPTDELSLEAWNNLVATNLTGAFLCAREAFRTMKTQEPQGGRIINNGSVSAHVPRQHSAAYTATKSAITGLTRSLSLDGRPYRIACGQIDIGNATADPRDQGQVAGEQGEPTMGFDDVARAVGYMAGLSLGANVQFMTVMATAMPYIGRG